MAETLTLQDVGLAPEDSSPAPSSRASVASDNLEFGLPTTEELEREIYGDASPFKKGTQEILTLEDVGLTKDSAVPKTKFVSQYYDPDSFGAKLDFGI